MFITQKHIQYNLNTKKINRSKTNLAQIFYLTSADSETLKVKDSSRNRRFSVGTNPSKKMLIP